MEIVLFQSTHKQNFVDSTEFNKASKHRLGCKPVTMSQRVTITGLRSKINTAFKRELTLAISKHERMLRKDVACTVKTDYGVFRVVLRSPAYFANTLANLMLIELKKDKKPLTNKENILSLAAVFAKTKKAK